MIDTDCVLVKDFSNLTRTNGAATFTDSETQTLIASYGVDELNDNFYVVTGHYHFNAFGKSDFTGYVEGTDVELRTIVVVERSVTATFFLLQDINRSFELAVGLNNTRVADYHTTLDFLLIDTTEEQTYVVTGFALIEELAEHFNTGNGRLEVSTKTHDLNFVTNLYDAGFDTTGGNSTTTGNREHVFNRHKEGLVDISGRQGNPVVDSLHKLNHLFFPLGFAVKGTESRTTDDGSFITVIFVSREKFAHFHFNELEHFFIVYHVALVQEHNDTGNVHLTSQKDVFASLRHRTVSSSNYNNSAVHLSSTGNHVLHIVSVTRAVNVSIVTVSGFIFNVSSIDCNTTLFFFRSIVDLVERLNFRKTFLSEHGSNSCGKSSLTVVNVTDSTDVYMRFGSFEFLFSHNFICYIVL